MLTAAERSVPADYSHAISSSSVTVILLLTVKVCRWDWATCFVRHKLMWLNCVNSCHRVKPTHRERAVGNHTITSSSTSQLCAVICPQVQWIRRVSRKSLRWGRSSCCEHSEPPGKLVRTHMHARVCVCVKKHGSGVTEILWLHGDFGEAITRSLSISRTKPWFTALASECAFLPFANDKPLNGIIRHHPWLRTILEHRRPVPCYNTSIILTKQAMVWFLWLATGFSGQV